MLPVRARTATTGMAGGPFPAFFPPSLFGSRALASPPRWGQYMVSAITAKTMTMIPAQRPFGNPRLGLPSASLGGEEAFSLIWKVTPVAQTQSERHRQSCSDDASLPRNV